MICLRFFGLIVLLFWSDPSFGQNKVIWGMDRFDTARVRHRAMTVIRKSLVTDNGYDRHRARQLVNKMTYMIVPCFELKESASNYVDGESLTKYLRQNTSHYFEYVLTFDDGRFTGSLSNTSEILNNLRQFGVYDIEVLPEDTIAGEKRNYRENQSSYWSWRAIELMKPYFAFSIKYFRNSWWVISDDKVWVIDLSTQLIMPEQDFLRANCGQDIIRKLALGNLERYCK